MKPFYVTTPIYYVNSYPHIGHTYTTVVADAIARYQRLRGSDVRFLTGTDEHGEKIARAAAEQGLEPLAWADQVVAAYRRLWGRFEISEDDFIRTTEPRHRAGVEEIVRRIDERGDLYLDHHEGWYCTSCEAFYTEKELLEDEVCPVHERPAEWHEEENVFFRLSRYQESLLSWYRDNPEAVRPGSRANEVKRFVEGGLRDLSVSRVGLDWGIPFPGRPGQTIYVWLDALTNYVSALGFGRPGENALYRRFWEEDAGVRLHLVGKDILRFHAVYWPAFLMSAGLPLPTTIYVHGWWLQDERKVSKSTGNVPRLDDLVESFGADGVRYFLLRDMVFGQDSSYSDEAFIDRFNTDLANGLGNTLSRVVTLAARAFEGRSPPVPCADNPVRSAAERSLPEYRAAMEELAFDRGLKALWRILGEANQYLVEREPWKLIKSEGPTPRLSRILWNGMEAVRLVATALLPVMPELAPRVLRALGIEEPPESLEALTWGGMPTGRPLPEPQPLFPRIDKETYLETSAEGPAVETEAREGPAKEDKMIDLERFFETELRVGTVRVAEAIPKSEKLLKLSVDLGEETHTLVAGIAREYPAEELVGRQVVVVANLHPAKLMGVESQGMVLAASVDGKPVLLHPDSEVPDGSPVR